MNARQKAKRYKKELQALRDRNNPRKEYFVTHADYPIVKLRAERKVDLYDTIRLVEEDAKQDLFRATMEYIHAEYDPSREVVTAELWVIKR